MASDLYFIPILARALEQQRTRTALREAFVEIERLGRKPSYERGLAQFHRFMAAVHAACERAEEVQRLNEESLVIEAVFDMPSDDADQRHVSLELIRSTDAWSRYEHVRRELARTEALPLQLDIRLERGGRVVGSVTLKEEAPNASVADVVPGSYELILGTGRLLWEGELTAADCIWSAAFPGEPLALAAETAETRRRPSREIPLFEGELMLRVYPGIEAGRLELEWQRPLTRRRNE